MWYDMGLTQHISIRTAVACSILVKIYACALAYQEQTQNIHSYIGVPAERRRREVVDNIVIETVLILDEHYISNMRAHGHSTNESLFELMTLKWMGVQAEWGREDVLRIAVTIAIKEIVLWETNPTWYTPSTNLDTVLYRICSGAKSRGLWTNFDSIHLFTGMPNTDVAGKSYTGDICKAGRKCSVSTDTRANEYVITAHELGHSMGMGHDGDVGCPSPRDGIMGYKTASWSTCSVAAVNLLLNQTTASCVYTTDVNVENKINITEAWPGMVYSDDEICRFINGAGYRFKKNPNNNVKCSSYSCINMDMNSVQYGVSFIHATPTDGSYCGNELVCSSQIVDNGFECIGWTDTGLDLSLITKVAGSWSAWESVTSCSRSCGTGVRYRQRVCDSPKPQNSNWCEGNEYYAEQCTIMPCENDTSDEPELIQQRAGEICTHWKSNSLFESIGKNSSKYLNTGSRYSNNGDGQCEVRCNTVEDYNAAWNERHGIIPDGTPCQPTSLSSFVETNNFPRKSGMFGNCVQGYCYLFGCDGVSGNTQMDGCGVCGGDNSTCQIIQGVYEHILATNERLTIVVLPTNASLIQFYFTYSKMKKHFLEVLANDSGKRIITFRALDTTKDPVSFAGTHWYLLWYKQYLYAQGPLDQDVVITLYNYGGNNNTGVHYAYSLPPASSEFTTSPPSSTTTMASSTVPSSNTTRTSTTMMSTTDVSSPSITTYSTNKTTIEKLDQATDASRIILYVVVPVCGALVLVAVCFIIIRNRRLHRLYRADG